MEYDGPGAADGSILGFCPGCGARIPSEALLIAYDAAGEWPTVFAECPDCTAVVHPV